MEPMRPALLLACDVPSTGTAVQKGGPPGNALEALDVRDGDRVVVVKGRVPEFGDLAALCVAGGARTLWKVFPEGERMHLSNGRGRWTVPAKNVEAIGVVVAVLRKFGR